MEQSYAEAMGILKEQRAGLDAVVESLMERTPLCGVADKPVGQAEDVACHAGSSGGNAIVGAAAP
eukprot:6041480-Pyramimonas_sp.AAC.1